MIVWQYVSMDCIPINLEMAMASTRKRKIVNKERASSLLLASAACSKSTPSDQTSRAFEANAGEGDGAGSSGKRT